MYRECYFCGSKVDDGGFTKFGGEDVWIGIVCGCDDRIDEVKKKKVDDIWKKFNEVKEEHHKRIVFMQRFTGLLMAYMIICIISLIGSFFDVFQPIVRGVSSVSTFFGIIIPIVVLIKFQPLHRGLALLLIGACLMNVIVLLLKFVG